VLPGRHSGNNPMTTISESQRKAARAAAVLYLLMAVSAPFALLYVPSKLIVPGDATATADRFRTSELLLRLGIGAELFHQAVAIFWFWLSTACSRRSTKSLRCRW